MVVNVKNAPLNPLAFAIGVDASNKGARAKLFNAATAAPATTNDNTQGYQQGSIWSRTDTRQVWICDDVTTNAAVWTQLELSDHPGYIVGNWYIPPGIRAFSSGAAPGAGSIRLLPDYIKERITINALGVRINTLSAAGNVQAAIYANNPLTNRPTGAALTSTASMTTGSVANVNASASMQLEPGLYWFATNCDNGTAVFTSPASYAASSTVGSPTQTNTLVGNQGLVGVSTPQTFGTWPDLTSATFTDVNASSIPVVQFKIGSTP